MDTPDLQALKNGDQDAWDLAYDWLWPTALAVVQGKMGHILPADVEDVAIESLEALVAKVPHLKSSEELRPLTAAIAHNRAVSRLREHYAEKRGRGEVESLDKPTKDGEPRPEPTAAGDPLATIHADELAKLLALLLAELKPDQRAVLEGFFLQGLTYEELASKHAMPSGTVGGNIMRGLKALRLLAARDPKLLKDLGNSLR